MTLGKKIKEARKNCGLSQEQLAEKLAVSRSAVAKWESDNGLPDIENLKSLAVLLNVSIDYLLHDGSQFFVTVTDEFIEIRRILQRITAEKFEIGDWQFIKCKSATK